METKVNLCRVKVHCLSFMRRLWELTFRVTAVQNWRLSNKYHICAFLFYEFQRPRLDFSGGSRGGAGGATPPLIFRRKWGPKGPKSVSFQAAPPPLPGSATWFDRLPSGQSEREVIKILQGILFQLYSCWFYWKLIQKNDERVWDLPSLHNTRYCFCVSQESEGNISARHARCDRGIEVRQAVKGKYSVYRVSSLCFSAVNSLGGPLWKLNDTIFVAILKNLNKFN